MQLPVYLGGTTKGWYETLPIEDRKDYIRLRDKLVKSFQRKEVPVRRLQELIGRNQQPNETVRAYAYAKLKLCNQLDRHMTERNKVIYFIQGLRRDTKLCIHQGSILMGRSVESS